jgi:hypothetical protein
MKLQASIVLFELIRPIAVINIRGYQFALKGE